MISNDVYQQLWEWFKDPMESLDVEVKWWLNFENTEHKWLLAKALIALENHWGWRLVVGYTNDSEGRLVPDVANRPATLENYSTDNINNILSRFTEPKFHVDVTLQLNPKTWEEYPVICVHWQTKIPVRSASETSSSIKLNRYYIRRPGPSSDEPRDGIEWDRLMTKCMWQKQAEIIDILRSFSDKNTMPGTDEFSQLNDFSYKSNKRWSEINDTLSSPVKNTLWYYAFSCQILGTKKGLKNKKILDSMSSLRKYTWWPLFILPYTKDEWPNLIWDCLEVSVKHTDSSHANFWRICPEGFIYVLRWYQEDCREDVSPGSALDITLPVWRLGEFLIIANELWKIMFEEGFSLVVTAEWTGAENRHIISLDHRRHVSWKYECHNPIIQTRWKFDSSSIDNLLSDVVKALLEEFYEKFSFLVVPDELFKTEIDRLRNGRF